MPTGDQKEAKLCFAVCGGVCNEMSCIKYFDSFTLCDDEGNDDFEPFSLEPHSFSFEFDDRKGSSLFVKFLRLTMPNNWLKMYGIPMRRRGLLEKERFKQK